MGLAALFTATRIAQAARWVISVFGAGLAVKGYLGPEDVDKLIGVFGTILATAGLGAGQKTITTQRSSAEDLGIDPKLLLEAQKLKAANPTETVNKADAVRRAERA